MPIRIRISRETVKHLMNALPKAYKSGDAQMVKRINVLLDFSRGDQPEEIARKHGIGASSVYAWLKQLLTEGLTSLKPCWRGGRPRKLTTRQRQQLSQWLHSEPQAVGTAGSRPDPARVWRVVQRPLPV